LTEEQIDRYHLPSAPDEPNKVELDALEVFHPGETANILEEAVTKYIDLEVYEQVEQLNHELRDEAYQKVLEKLDPIRNQLESIRLDTELQGQLSSAAIVEEGDNWLYASTRSYINQTFNFRTFLDSRDESEPSPRSVE
jgi:hypothetical protein